MQVIIGILALSVLIIVHELGHFLVAKASGILVHEFSLFMGPKIYSVKKGETTYSLRAIPLGGYVRMEGEEEASDNERAFNRKPISTRIAVIAAGPIMNLIIAFVFFFIFNSYSGYTTTVINQIADKSPAVSAKLQKGDKIISYNGNKVYDDMDVMLFIYASKGSAADVVFERNGKQYKTTLTPDKYEETTRYILGFTPKDTSDEYGKDSNLVDSVSNSTPAERAGIKSGDRIVKVNDTKIASRHDLNSYLLNNKEKPVDVTIERNGQTQTIAQVSPMLQKTPEQYFIGFDFAGEKGNLTSTIKQSVISCYSTTRQMYYSLVWLINRTIPSKNMMGPVGIVTSIGTVVQQSPGVTEAIMNLLKFLALISVNLGVFNLIPFPALDGSKIILMIIEKIRRKPIPPEKEATISLVGFAILIFIMIFATSNDIMRIFNKL